MPKSISTDVLIAEVRGALKAGKPGKMSYAIMRYLSGSEKQQRVILEQFPEFAEPLKQHRSMMLELEIEQEARAQKADADFAAKQLFYRRIHDALVSHGASAEYAALTDSFSGSHYYRLGDIRIRLSDHVALYARSDADINLSIGGGWWSGAMAVLLDNEALEKRIADILFCFTRAKKGRRPELPDTYIGKAIANLLSDWRLFSLRDLGRIIDVNHVVLIKYASGKRVRTGALNERQIKALSNALRMEEVQLCQYLNLEEQA